MSCVSKDSSFSEAPAYSDILDQIRRESVQKDEARVDDVLKQAYEAPDDDM